MNKSIVFGSLSDMARMQNRSIAETFIDVDAVIIVDISGSMSANDSRDNQSRWSVAGQELVKLQQNMPGKLAVIAFSDTCRFVPSGILPEVGRLGACTDLAGVLNFAKSLDVPGIKFVVISDGIPDNKQEAIRVARQIKANISTVYVGPDGGQGSAFLAELAGVAGGQNTTADRAMFLSGKIKRLLLTS